jgi:tRNA modification GTPase
MNKSYKESHCIFSNITSLFGSSVILVRISGKLEEIQKVCNTLKITKPLIHNKCFLSKIYSDAEVLDEAVITFFEAPKSFTGETCLEIALHGSRFIFHQLSEILIKCGLRFAENGEFSYRAFLNGKMNLVKAEGMAALIASETDVQHKIAMRQFEGENTKKFEVLKNSVLEILGNLESLIDFSDEDLPPEISSKIEKQVAEISLQIENILKNSSAISLQEGLKLAIIGRPNAGKSSIFNTFVGHSKAIVSAIAGTTRDVIEERIILKGVPLIFYDTAGIRFETKDEIELEGIRRAKSVLSKSDIKLLVKSADSKETFAELAKELNFEIDKNTILVINKIDLSVTSEEGVKISAITGKGFEDLFSNIETLIEKNFLSLIEGSLISSERQKILLKDALTNLKQFNFGKEVELASEDLRRTAIKLQSIIGTIDVEDVLGNIFSKFCIGK